MYLIIFIVLGFLGLFYLAVKGIEATIKTEAKKQARYEIERFERRLNKKKDKEGEKE